MAKKYDVVIIGAGPNGLVAGAYLSKAGLKTLIVEKRLEAGGGLATEESTLPMFLHNTHSVYHMMVDYAPAYKDLKLDEEYRVKYVHPPLQFVMPFRDGKSLCLYTDVQKTCDSIARFSRRDADAYREMYHRFHCYMEEFLAPATYVPPLSALDQAVKLEATPIGKEILELSEKSPREIIDEIFENEQVKTLMLYAACHWGLEPEVEGVGYLVPLYLNRATHYRLSVGGSHMVAQALGKIVLENGGLILGSQEVRRILLEGGRARGVETESGDVMEAEKAVVSTLNPEQTFLKLVRAGNLDEEFVEKIKLWKWEKWSLLQIHLALESLPHFKIGHADLELNRGLVYVLGYESPEDLFNHWRGIERGELDEKAGFHCSFPSIHDPSQAPPGRCTGLISQMAPYALNSNGANWLNLRCKEEEAERRLRILEEYAPGIRDKILWKAVSTPADTENRFLDMKKGSIKQGAYLPLQMGYLRPNEDCSDTRTPIRGLYLGGASCHPGGLVILGPGYLVANAVAEDLGLTKWWTEPEIVQRARAKGVL
jgi:phytoene dehydrogenase-like protein